MKATWCEIDGVGLDMFKLPVTGNGVKNSAVGRLAVVRGPSGLELVTRATAAQEETSLLQPVWKDGKFLARDTFDKIRTRVLEQLP